MFEMVEGLVLRVPYNLSDFHNFELVNEHRVVLQSEMHREWLARGGAAPRINQWIEHRIPLFLGGADVIGNLLKTDIRVYWHTTAELIAKTKDLPDGTEITQFSFVGN